VFFEASTQRFPHKTKPVGHEQTPAGQLASTTTPPPEVLFAAVLFAVELLAAVLSVFELGASSPQPRWVMLNANAANKIVLENLSAFMGDSSLKR